MRALLAGVQFKAALGTLAKRLGDQGKHGAALSAAGDGVRARHLHRAGAECVFAGRTVRSRFLLFRAAVLVAALAVFAVGQEFLPN